MLVDSLQYAGITQNFWGIHVTTDTIFLGADLSGAIYYSDHAGNLLGQQSTGFTFDHGLVRTPTSYLIAQDYAANGAHLYEIDLSGTLLNTWMFPDVIGGHSSGIGDLFPDGNAVWYTMYYPDFNTDPYAYAYRWVPGDATANDTVPLHGEQPYGIAIKGDTLFYVTDNLNGDQERIYAYDLTNEQDIGWIELPDTPIDNDQSPRGMYYDGTHLYLIANRSGGSANAYQNIYIYAFDNAVGSAELHPATVLPAYPDPADDHLTITLPFTRTNGEWEISVLDGTGRIVSRSRGDGQVIDLDTGAWPTGAYQARVTRAGGPPGVARFLVVH